MAALASSQATGLRNIVINNWVVYSINLSILPVRRVLRWCSVHFKHLKSLSVEMEVNHMSLLTPPTLLDWHMFSLEVEVLKEIDPLSLKRVFKFDPNTGKVCTWRVNSGESLGLAANQRKPGREELAYYNKIDEW
jgi:hypothetical protein